MDVQWRTTDPSVATVTDGGLTMAKGDGSSNVTGQSTGTATIVATSNADASKSGAAELEVSEP